MDPPFCVNEARLPIVSGQESGCTPRTTHHPCDGLRMIFRPLSHHFGPWLRTEFLSLEEGCWLRTLEAAHYRHARSSVPGNTKARHTHSSNVPCLTCVGMGMGLALRGERGWGRGCLRAFSDQCSQLKVAWCRGYTATKGQGHSPHQVLKQGGVHGSYANARLPLVQPRGGSNCPAHTLRALGPASTPNRDPRNAPNTAQM